MLQHWENGFVGFKGQHHSDEAKKLISDHNGNKDGKYTLTSKRQAHLKELANSNMGRIQSSEERLKRSASLKLAYEKGTRVPSRAGGRQMIKVWENYRNTIFFLIEKRRINTQHINHPFR